MINKQSKKSNRTKKKILDCAERLFYEKGFDKTAVREIVEAAGVAQGTFYLYFETKEQVLYTILKKVVGSINDLLNRLDTEEPKFEDLDQLIDSIVCYMEENPKSIAILHNSSIIQIMSLGSNTDKDSFVLNGIEKWIENAKNKGLIGDKEGALYAKMIFKITHELLESAFLYGYPGDIDVVKQEVKKIIKSILR